MRRRRILLAEFVVRMDDTRLPECVMFGELMGGASCVGGQKKEWIRCLLDDLRAFVINADQWTTAAQDEGEWRRTAEQGAEHFMAKWIAAEKARARLRHGVYYILVVVCPNVKGRTKERIVQSKRSCAGSLAIVDQPQVARTCILRVFLFADAILLFSGVTFFFLRFSSFLLSSNLRPFVQSFFHTVCMPPDSYTQLANTTTVCVPFCYAHFPFLCIYMIYDIICRISRVLCTIAVSFLYDEEYAALSPSGWCSLPCDRGLDFDISLLCENPVNQSTCC